jgi:hypothetical protein
MAIRPSLIPLAVCIADLFGSTGAASAPIPNHPVVTVEPKPPPSPEGTDASVPHHAGQELTRDANPCDIRVYRYGVRRANEARVSPCDSAPNSLTLVVGNGDQEHPEFLIEQQ